MSRSAIYVANTTSTSVATGATVPLGSVIRRFGQCVDLSGNAINVQGAGYYDVDVSLTATVPAVGNLTATLLQNGVAVPGATATAAVTTAGNAVNLSFSALIRQPCNCGNSALTIVLTGTGITTTPATVTNVGVIVEKL